MTRPAPPNWKDVGLLAQSSVTGTLAAPLARALEPYDVFAFDIDPHGSLLGSFVPILAALRADPAVLEAMAEALHEGDCYGGDAVGLDTHLWADCQHQAFWLKRAAALLDALLGKP